MSRIVIEGPDTAVIEAEQTSIATFARSVQVRSVEEDAAAQAFLLRVAQMADDIEDLFAAPKKAAHAAHKAICAAEAKLLKPCQDARSVVQPKVLAWQQEQRRKADDDRRRLEAEARRIEEERQLAAAIAAEEAGDAAVAEEILAEPVMTPVVTVAPQVADVAGVTTQVRWRAEVTDLRALIAHVAANLEWRHLLLPAMPALNALARSQREMMRLPGVQAVREEGLAVRRTG